MEKVYVIEECVGSYDDKFSKPIKAYRSYDRAKVECDRLNNEMKKLRYSFDKLEDEEAVGKNIENVKEYIFKQTKPLLFDKWYQIYHSEDTYSWNDEWEEIENEYYDVTDKVEGNVITFIDIAKEMGNFSETELREMEIYLTYVGKCYMKSINEGLPSYYLSDNGVELVD